MPYDLAIPLVDIYLDKTITQKDTWNPMFIAALFKIAKTWKQPNCPPADEWIKKHTHHGIVFRHKKWGNSAFCDNMNGSWGHYAKWNKSEKDKYHMLSYM